MEKVISIPNAIRTFEALRNLGYDLNSSIADLVDNSITSKVKAEYVSISFKVENEKFNFHIYDNGTGMNSAELEEAMRIGSDTKYRPGDLGKFGMGMKTASLTHCNILTVISKKVNAEITGYKWDLNHVKIHNDGWNVFKLNDYEIGTYLKNEKIKIDESGTLVIWEDLFLLNSEYRSYPTDKLATNYFFRIEENLKLYISMIFHRFLAKRELSIYINNDKLRPWDPFWRKEPNTHEVNLSKSSSEFSIRSNIKPVIINAFILPNKESFSSEESWKEAKGLLSWNASQGYYIYREDRIIRFGGWQGTRALEEHDKLARISIDINSDLDKYFRIRVNKSGIEFPEALFNHLKNTVNPIVIKNAKKYYSPAAKEFKNKFRKQENKLDGFKRNFVKTNGIKTNAASSGNEICVVNPNGTWIANRVSEFLKFGTNKDFEVVSGIIDEGHFWKLVCNTNEKIKIVINQEHPFYKKFYNSGSNKNISNAIDAFAFSLAFAELYNRNSQNANLFDTFKTIFSQALEKITIEKLI